MQVITIKVTVLNLSHALLLSAILNTFLLITSLMFGIFWMIIVLILIQPNALNLN